MSSIKETMEQFAALYQELEHKHFLEMVETETARFNEIISQEISDVLLKLIDTDNLNEDFVVEVMPTHYSSHLIILKNPVPPKIDRVINFESPLPLKYLREELRKAHGVEEKDYDESYNTDIYRYTFNFPEIAQ